ncbi:hypothetical protein AVEN_90519-1, partial [Araneus ventricosus]
MMTKAKSPVNACKWISPGRFAYSSTVRSHGRHLRYKIDTVAKWIDAGPDYDTANAGNCLVKPHLWRLSRFVL